MVFIVVCVFFHGLRFGYIVPNAGSSILGKDSSVHLFYLFISHAMDEYPQKTAVPSAVGIDEILCRSFVVSSCHYCDLAGRRQTDGAFFLQVLSAVDRGARYGETEKNRKPDPKLIRCISLTEE